MGLFSTHTYQEVAKPYEKSVTHKYEGLKPEDATKLLRDYEKEAEGNIIQSLHIRTNVFEGAVVILDQNPASLDKVFKARFFLNKEEFNVEAKVDHFLTEEEIYKKVLEIVSESIALKLIKLAITYRHQSGSLTP